MYRDVSTTRTQIINLTCFHSADDYNIIFNLKQHHYEFNDFWSRQFTHDKINQTFLGWQMRTTWTFHWSNTKSIAVDGSTKSLWNQFLWFISFTFKKNGGLEKRYFKCIFFKHAKNLNFIWCIFAKGI